ncbi:fibronectin-like [Heteronotia binoei]|uniref:fibronectin-like n=1 Tax=Heteronotia binoei TaxID=13085 RepID=UPI00292DB4A4|nr:fibronectin-like [Heteronotia binoei]
MASIMGYLMYGLLLLPLLTANEVPPPCIFPFIYNRKSYSSCTGDGSGNKKLWCATTGNYDTNHQWKYCTLTEYGGNTAGQACTFPFAYKSRTFYSCTNEDIQIGKFWCATTGSYDKDKKWSYCADTRVQANQIGPCVFPFTYKGKLYSSCTTAGASTGKLWCSLTSNYDIDPKWTYCDPSEPRPCHLPFIFKGKSYSACTKEGAGDGQLWCATTANYDTDSKWKPCSQQEYEGNSNGQTCVFPFIYKNRTFYTCTSEDSKDGRFWCATTGSYDKDEKWSYCADTSKFTGDCPEGPCVFPFTYKGKLYSSCTTAGASTGKLWCSLTSNYDIDPKWTYCDPSEPRPCHLPFIFKGKSYSACTKEGAGDGQLWCATTANYDTDSKWKPCSQQEYEGNSNGQTCVFPFIYKNRTFYTCTSEDSKDGRFWCATTGSYDKDKKWSYCADTRQHENNMGPCVFPFIYKGKTYPSCTTAGESTGKLWCSLTSNYDTHPKWTYCNPSAKKTTTRG